MLIERFPQTVHVPGEREMKSPRTVVPGAMWRRFTTTAGAWGRTESSANAGVSAACAVVNSSGSGFGFGAGDFGIRWIELNGRRFANRRRALVPGESA